MYHRIYILFFTTIFFVPIFATEEAKKNNRANAAVTNSKNNSKNDVANKTTPEAETKKVTTTTEKTVPSKDEPGKEVTEKTTTTVETTVEEKPKEQDLQEEGEPKEEVEKEKTEAPPVATEKKAEAPQEEAKKEEPAKSEIPVQKTPEPEAKPEPAIEKPQPSPEPSKPVPVREEKPSMPTAPLAAAPTIEPKPAPYVSEKEEEVGVLNIDTIDLDEPKGNWLLKRRWWEQAQRTYEKIKQQVDQVFEARMVFYNQRAELDRNVFSNFYQQIGIGEGELQVIVSDLMAQLEEKKDAAQDGEKTKNFIALLQKEKENLDTLQKDIDLVVEWDRAINEALIKLREQISIARRYEQEAWANFKQIAIELSDKRAYELYYTMKGLSKNISEISSWVNGPFQNYFMQLINKVKDQIGKVKNEMQELKNKGIDIKRDIERFEKTEQIEKEQEIEEEQEQEPSLLGKIGYVVSLPFVYIWKVVKAIGSFVGSLFSGAYTGVRGLFITSEPMEETEDQ